MIPRLQIEYVGTIHHVSPGTTFGVGRAAELVLDDNPHLHRLFLEIDFRDGHWWLTNRASATAVTLTGDGGMLRAVLAPGASIPIVSGTTTVTFQAGPTGYEFSLHNPDGPSASAPRPPAAVGEATIDGVRITPSQRRLLVALAEPLLRLDGVGLDAIPTSAAAAARLGCSIRSLHRTLDNLCARLTAAGVEGLHGGTGAAAIRRRTRLVTWAVESRFVTRDDLALLQTEVAP